MVISGLGVGACTATGALGRGNGDIVGAETVLVLARVGATVGWVSGEIELSTGGFSGQSGGGLSEREQIPSRIQSA